MSRLGKQPISIPTGVKAEIKDGNVLIEGPKGKLEREFDIDIIDISINENEITLKPKKEDIFSRSLWGTYASHVINMIKGVTEGYEKKLVIEGVGFKSQVKGNILDMSLGFSHTVEVEIPEDITVTAEKNVVTISGINKENVGAFAGKVRAKKKPEPYKGKGIRYEDEIVRRKQGKKAA